MGNNMDDLKGRAKEAAGDLTNDDSMKREGKIDQAKSKVKDAADTVMDKAKDIAGKD